MNPTMIQYPESETSRVPYSTFSETVSANYFTSITPLTESAIEIVRDQFVIIGFPLDNASAIVITNV